MMSAPSVASFGISAWDAAIAAWSLTSTSVLPKEWRITPRKSAVNEYAVVVLQGSDLTVLDDVVTSVDPGYAGLAAALRRRN